MKRTLEPDMSTASNNTPPKERLLLVLVPEKFARVRRTLGLPEHRRFHDDNLDYLSVFEYEMGSADRKFGLDTLLEDLAEADDPDADTTSLPLLLRFICDSYLFRLPKELTHEDDEPTPFATAKPQDLGKWAHEVTNDGKHARAFKNGPYKAVHFIPYDPAVVAHVEDIQKLREDYDPLVVADE